MDESAQFRLVKPVFVIFAHNQSTRVINILEIYNSVAKLSKFPWVFLRMSVTETSLPETYKLFGIKNEIAIYKYELSWDSKEMIAWLSCVCQSC